ncbi:MAG: helix-turn-helix domain-containing protein [Desulfobacterales bacterium]|nr:helix-turn-helix domain-containing protein [Desulfobacterales bacterium]
MKEKYLLTLDDLVELTQLPKSWWYTRTRQTGPGSLPVVKCGKYLRFRWDEVQKWLRKQNEADL